MADKKLMNIKAMLVRLQSAMGRNDLIEQMVLRPEPASLHSNADKSTKSVNLVVGYNRSPSSQTALDVTLWIAHQTRLTTKAQVTVHIVYTVDDQSRSKAAASNPSLHQRSWESREAAQPRMTSVDPSYLRAMFYHNHQIEQADRILWQARCLAHEWGGAFVAHLRFGCVDAELRKVVVSEAADLLYLGCSAVNHPLVQKLGYDFPCPVLGIPKTSTAKPTTERDLVRSD